VSEKRVNRSLELRRAARAPPTRSEREASEQRAKEREDEKKSDFFLLFPLFSFSNSSLFLLSKAKFATRHNGSARRERSREALLGALGDEQGERRNEGALDDLSSSSDLLCLDALAIDVIIIIFTIESNTFLYSLSTLFLLQLYTPRANERLQDPRRAFSLLESEAKRELIGIRKRKEKKKKLNLLCLLKKKLLLQKQQLFNKELAAERKAALRADLAVGHFDDLKGAKTASKPFAAREVPERAALLLPSLDLDVVSKRVASGEEASSSFSSSSSTTLGEVLSEALHGGGRRQQEGYQRRTTTRRGPVLLLLGSRASAEPALDSWAAAWAKAVASSSSSSRSSSSSSSSSPQPPPPPPIVDLTLFDRVSPILLALPGGKSALLRGAAEGARRRGAAAAAAHFGAAGGREIREAIGATNPLAGYGCVLDCRLGTGAAAPLAARVRWIGAGEAGAEEEEGLREVVASLLLLSSKEAEAEAEGGRG